MRMALYYPARTTLALPVINNNTLTNFDAPYIIHWEMTTILSDTHNNRRCGWPLKSIGNNWNSCARNRMMILFLRARDYFLSNRDDYFGWTRLWNYNGLKDNWSVLVILVVTYDFIGTAELAVALLIPFGHELPYHCQEHTNKDDQNEATK